MLITTPSVGAALGPWGPEKIEGSGVGGTRAEGEDAGTEVLQYAPLKGAAHSTGISTAGWSSAGRGRERGISRHRSMVRLASESRRRSNLGSSGKPICSSTWHRSLENKRGVDSARGRLLRWTLSSKWNK